MYLSSDLRTIPRDAQIVAYTPMAYDGNVADFPNAIIVPVDTTLAFVRISVALDCVKYGFTTDDIHRWVSDWQRIHEDGFSSQNGTFFKPVILIEEDRIFPLRRILGNDAVDWWAYSPGARGIPFPMAFAKLYRTVVDTGLKYSISAVWDDTWGVKPQSEPDMEPGTYTTLEPLKGVVTWNDASGLYTRKVWSFDGGAEWHLQ